MIIVSRVCVLGKKTRPLFTLDPYLLLEKVILSLIHKDLCGGSLYQ